MLAARERDGRAVGARAVARVRGSAWTCVSASRAAQEPCSKRRSSRCGLARRERSVEPRHHRPKSQSARSGGPTEFPTGPERSVWRPDRFPTGPERSVWRPDRFHSTARKKTVFNEKYGFVVDFFDRRYRHRVRIILRHVALWKVRVLPGRRDARCATAAERGGPTDNRDTPRGTIDARARLASAIARHRHRQSATTVRPPPRRRYPRHRPALATAAQAATVATSLAAAEAACSMATRWRSATGSCPTFVLKATSASTKGMVDGHARHERERIRAPEATWWRRDARSQWPADGDAGRRR